MCSMRRFTTLVAAILLSWAAASATPAFAQDPTLPPTVLAPDDGASITAGAGVTFRVQSDVPDDDNYLWVHISRSPAPADACGTIDDDLGISGLDPAGDENVYTATPTLYQTYTYWLNRPGTYYWQAYRIHYGGGADGCIEAPVRALVVTGIRPIEIGPQPLEPGDGAQLPTGGLAFRVSALASDQEQSMWVRVSRSQQVGADGLIGDDAELERLSRSGDPTVFYATPAYFSDPGFWMNVAGTYFWQSYRISFFGDPDGFVEGPVRSFTLTGTPPPPPATVPPGSTPREPATIRGDEAFVTGTANDLYLACTTLDVYLVDVLPAGRKVAVTGAADLRLRGRTVAILLDGKRVGNAVVRSTGAFAATVKAPTRARRARARYRAVVGSARSQNLKLVRRMVAARLTRTGDRLTLTGRLTKPFAARPAKIGVERYVACGRKQTLRVKAVRPSRTGRFTVTFPMPNASVRALMYRARTKVATRTRGAPTSTTYTLPRAVNVR